MPLWLSIMGLILLLVGAWRTLIGVVLLTWIMSTRLHSGSKRRPLLRKMGKVLDILGMKKIAYALDRWGLRGAPPGDTQLIVTIEFALSAALFALASVAFSIGGLFRK